MNRMTRMLLTRNPVLHRLVPTVLLTLSLSMRKCEVSPQSCVTNERLLVFFMINLNMQQHLIYIYTNVMEEGVQEKAFYLDVIRKKLIILTKRGHRLAFARVTFSLVPNLLTFDESMLECALICDESLSNGFEKSMWASVESDRNWDDLFCKIIYQTRFRT